MTLASEEYVDLVKSVADEIGIGKFITINVFNMKKSNKDVIKVRKSSEPMEVSLDGEDMIDVYLYEEAFDLMVKNVEEGQPDVRRFWIEVALSRVHYNMDKSCLEIGKDPEVTVPLAIYDKYKGASIQMLSLGPLTIQHIKDKEKQKKAEEKEKKKAMKKFK